MKTETTHAGGFILSEEEGNYCRKNITIDDSVATALEDGTVLGIITSGGNWAKYDQQASDGTQTAAGILYGRAAVTSADQAAVAIVRGPVVVNANELVWPDGSPTDKTAGIADLLTLGIVVR